MTPLLQDGQSTVTNSPIKTPRKIGDKMGFLSRKNAVLLVGGVILALSFCRSFSPAAAQSAPTPTPLPQVAATQQAADAAAAQVSGLQAERAQTEARLSEINRNIEAQIVEAERAAADARNAAATQNAVEAGAAIGRLEGALAQLRTSYAGKDDIIADLQARNEQQAAARAEDRRTIDRTGLELLQAQTARQTAVNAYNALSATRKTESDNEMVNNGVKLTFGLAIVLAAFGVVAYVIQHRPATVVFAPPAEDVIDDDIIDGDAPCPTPSE